MKRLLPMVFLIFLASPVFAQEGIDLGGFLLDLPAPAGARGAPPARGPAPARGPNAPPVDRLVRLRELLAQASQPLAKEQETALNTLLDAEIPNMRTALRARILELQKAKGGGVPGPAGAPASAPSPEEVAPEINRLNDQLLARIGEAPALKPDQQDVIKKLYRDQIRSRRGFDALKLTMEEAGVAFSPEQTAQIQPLFDEQNKGTAQLAKESQGQPPDKAKMDQLERETLAKVLKLLTAPQRTALLSPPKQ